MIESTYKEFDKVVTKIIYSNIDKDNEEIFCCIRDGIVDYVRNTYTLSCPYLKIGTYQKIDYDTIIVYVDFNKEAPNFGFSICKHLGSIKEFYRKYGVVYVE